MLFPEEDSEHLKQWLVTRLGQTSDADADVLADYVLALLSNDGDTETVRNLCMAEIPDFVQDNPTQFISDLFDAIHYKSYLPGAPAPPQRQTSMPFAPPTGPSSMPPFGVHYGGQNGNRKRAFNERGDGDVQDRGMGMENGRVYKQPRRGMPGRGGYGDFNGRGGFNGRPPHGNGPSIEQSLLPAIDPNNPPDPMALMMAIQNMGQSMGFPITAPLPGQGPPAQKAPRRGRCRDYEQKGFCARGNTCMYEHGENSIWVPPGQTPDEYDPSNATLMTGVEGNGMGSPGAFNNYRGNDRGRGRGARGDRGHGNAGRRGGRAEFSSDRPNFDRAKTTIVVENIPEESFSEEAVREFFSQFGEIVDVSMRPYKRLSIVKYDSWDAAQAAYGSPKVIFDNRFVKVYWYTTPDALPQPPASATSANGAPKRETNSQGPVPARDTDEPMIDPEEFARKQEEAQKVHDEKAKKKLEMEAARKELEKRQEELNRVRAEETRKLKEKLEAKAKLNGDAGAPTDAKTSQTEALKAQLAKLEAEAASLGLPGLDQPLPDEGYGYRGRGGRGRGYRGRGTFAPRGFRGGRGRGGAPFVGGGAYKLDNRPKKIAVSGVDFTEMGSDEALRSHLLGIGDFTSLDPTPSTTTITFKDRFTAEKFMNSAHDEIPGVGKVEMKWVTEPLPTPVKREEGEVDMKDVGAERVREREIKREEREREENLDYEVAGDEDYIG
ncbi:RNA-binding, RBD [Glarea lozoyensis ATCC 20868]|uniref:RNA-binding, RBD n=1 Tax=Glarea lozoyensis (strain ATCC 20868 / MF5171) TaxID=1116229 RepID=S3DH12_GLAL2|nr:RNA-binding, RBD [Glarea lozoyensis ATCC 20868]EPE31296.1 RNA-binding, RBD [Glarea lozoyensis ATCC 20868]